MTILSVPSASWAPNWDAPLTDLRLSEGWRLADGGIPDLHAGQVAFTFAIADAPVPVLNVYGKNSAGELETVTYEPETASSNLPKLLYTKHLIDTLFKADRDAQAIGLAREANIVCRGTTFIAWDETEKVAVAQQEVYQSSLSQHPELFDSPPSYANFFESKVTHYSCSLSLASCSDEELVGPLSSSVGVQALIKHISKASRLSSHVPKPLD